MQDWIVTPSLTEHNVASVLTLYPVLKENELVHCENVYTQHLSHISVKNLLHNETLKSNRYKSSLLCLHTKVQTPSTKEMFQ